MYRESGTSTGGMEKSVQRECVWKCTYIQGKREREAEREGQREMNVNSVHMDTWRDPQSR
jgi:hypothetical protein